MFYLQAYIFVRGSAGREDAFWCASRVRKSQPSFGRCSTSIYILLHFIKLCVRLHWFAHIFVYSFSGLFWAHAHLVWWDDRHLKRDRLKPSLVLKRQFQLVRFHGEAIQVMQPACHIPLDIIFPFTVQDNEQKCTTKVIDFKSMNE